MHPFLGPSVADLVGDPWHHGPELAAVVAATGPSWGSAASLMVPYCSGKVALNWDSFETGSGCIAFDPERARCSL